MSAEYKEKIENRVHSRPDGFLSFLKTQDFVSLRVFVSPSGASVGDATMSRLYIRLSVPSSLRPFVSPPLRPSVPPSFCRSFWWRRGTASSVRFFVRRFISLRPFVSPSLRPFVPPSLRPSALDWTVFPAYLCRP